MARLAPPAAPLACGALALAVLVVLAGLVAEPAVPQDRDQSTQLVSRARDGGIPNGPSTNGVISNDRRWARLIAYESEASDIAPRDTNGVKDVFAVQRAGSFGNKGTPWKLPGAAIRVSRARDGGPANGPSHSPAVDGSFDTLARCVAFLSAASNLVGGDTNGRTDAFLATTPGKAVRRVSLKGTKQLAGETTQVAISGDCTRVAFVTDGALRVWSGGRARRIDAPGDEADPSFATGKTNDLVFGAKGGAYLSANATGRPRLVAPKGRNPAYNSIKRRVVAYERITGGRSQVYARDLGRKERLVSGTGGTPGNGSSRHPVIGNSGFYVAFESDASNLTTNAAREREDGNDRTDSYLYSDVRDLSLLQSVEDTGRAMPGGGGRPSMAFYANYILFQSPAPLSTREVDSSPQVFMRYLGGI